MPFQPGQIANPTGKNSIKKGWTSVQARLQTLASKGKTIDDLLDLYTDGKRFGNLSWIDAACVTYVVKAMGTEAGVRELDLLFNRVDPPAAPAAIAIPFMPAQTEQDVRRTEFVDALLARYETAIAKANGPRVLNGYANGHAEEAAQVNPAPAVLPAKPNGHA